MVKELVQPIRMEFENRDMFQVMFGTSVLAVPVGFTEETWRLGEILPFANIFIILALTLIFISTFVYSHYHKGRIKSNPKHHLKHFSNRVLFTYIFSFAIVALLLSVIKVAPWTTDFVLAFKRTIIVAFPCSMGAAIADVLK